MPVDSMSGTVWTIDERPLEQCSAEYRVPQEMRHSAICKIKICEISVYQQSLCVPSFIDGKAVSLTVNCGQTGPLCYFADAVF